MSERLHDPDGYFPKNLRHLAENIERQRGLNVHVTDVYDGYVGLLRDLADRLEATMRPDGAHDAHHRQQSEAAAGQQIAEAFTEPMVPLQLVEPLLALAEDSPAREALVDWLVDQDARSLISDDSTDQKGGRPNER